MVEDLVAGFLGAFGGALLGTLAGRSRLAGWPAAWKRHPDVGHAESDWIEPDVSAQIDQAAHEWAASNGRSGTEGLVAEKLRLAHRLQVRRDRRW